MYEGSTKSLYIWNDMNEPSVFNGPEVRMATRERMRGVRQGRGHAFQACAAAGVDAGC